MAILLRCPFCGTEMVHNAKVCKRCGRRIPSHGKKYKVIVRTKDGRKKTRTVDRPFELAKQVEAKLKMDIIKGDILGETPKITFAELWKEYLEWAKVNKKSWKTDEYRCKKHLLLRFGNRKLEGITARDVEKMITDLAKEGAKPATIVRVVALLRHMFNMAIKWRYFNGLNPVSTVELPKENNKVIPQISIEKVKQLLKVLHN